MQLWIFQWTMYIKMLFWKLLKWSKALVIIKWSSFRVRDTTYHNKFKLRIQHFKLRVSLNKWFALKPTIAFTSILKNLNYWTSVLFALVDYQVEQPESYGNYEMTTFTIKGLCQSRREMLWEPQSSFFCHIWSGIDAIEIAIHVIFQMLKIIVISRVFCFSRSEKMKNVNYKGYL